MAKYTEKQIKEFAKMGYFIDENGNLTKEVPLQKIIRTNTDTQTMKNLDLKSFHMNTRNESEERAKVQRTMGNQFSRVQEWYMDEERLAKGLATMKKPGIDYSLLPDGTKVCRCCQERYPADHFSATNSRKDGKSQNCKKCDSRRQKTYMEAKKEHLAYKIKNQGK